MSAAHVKVFQLTLAVPGFFGVFLLEASQQTFAVETSVYELKLPDNARVQRFDFEHDGIEKWKTVEGKWTVEEMAGAPSGKRVLVQRATFGRGFLAVQLGMVGVQMLVNGTYVVVFLGRFGATLGKMALRLRVVNPDGSPIGYGKAIGRYFAEMLSGQSGGSIPPVSAPRGIMLLFNNCPRVEPQILALHAAQFCGVIPR